MGAGEGKAYSGTAILESLGSAKNYSDFLTQLIARRIKADDRVLDFGAGLGNFASQIGTHCRAIECLEPDPFLARKVRQNYSLICHETPKSIRGSFDIIYSLNVLEHIEDDLEALELLRSYLAPGGQLLLYVPASPILYSNFDRSIEHYRRYTRKGLKAKVIEAGFSIIEINYQDPLGWAAALVHKYMTKAKAPNTALITIFDRVLFPVSRFIQPVTKSFLGKNVFVRASKNS